MKPCAPVVGFLILRLFSYISAELDQLTKSTKSQLAPSQLPPFYPYPIFPIGKTILKFAFPQFSKTLPLPPILQHREYYPIPPYAPENVDLHPTLHPIPQYLGPGPDIGV